MNSTGRPIIMVSCGMGCIGHIDAGHMRLREAVATIAARDHGIIMLEDVAPPIPTEYLIRQAHEVDTRPLMMQDRQDARSYNKSNHYKAKRREKRRNR